MKYIITESQNDKIIEIIQSSIDSIWEDLTMESEDYDLSEMEEFYMIDSVENIVVKHVTMIDKIKVYLDIYVNKNILDYDNLRSEIQYRLGKWFPKIELYINEIIRDNSFGPGIDW
jgi:hypothetical protein